MIESFWDAGFWPAIGGFVIGFIAFRRDERAVQIANITAERKKWRDDMRSLVAEIAEFQLYPAQASKPGKIWKLRAKLAMSINPKDEIDTEILEHFDRLFFHGATDMDVFIERIALLLKHDWERVKSDCLPLHQYAWRAIWNPPPDWKDANYRRLSCELLRTEGPKNRWPDPHDASNGG